MHLSRLRLTGFKSFVEPTDLVIAHGLTGVVGPNGCGKSNLLEALRWVMGESSYKSMRASAMDDVIFAGTALRPARNMAEVTLFIDNRDRLAPAEFNDRDEIEISRRIEREAGSAYRINGREARARDVKILFEDAATGARSPALVRQGQISEIINAKPEARRRILEDAAGTAGLHSRRHEAELRLKAAEANLARLDDVVGGLNTQIDSLKRQARQARRYREISQEIGRVEALALYLSWHEADAAVIAEEANLAALMERLGVVTAEEARTVAREAEAAEKLPGLRAKVAEASAAAARIRHEIESFDKEAERQAARRSELADRLEASEKDLARESAMRVEAQETIARLETEIAEVKAADEGSEAEERQAQAQLEAATATLAKREEALTAATGELAQLTARREALERSRREEAAAVERLTRQVEKIEQESRETEASGPAAEAVSAAEAACRAEEEKLTEIETEAAAAEHAVAVARAEVDEARVAAQDVRLKAAALKSERESLTRLLASGGTGRGAHVPLIDRVTVTPGYEAALGAALGDDLDAPLDRDAPVHWSLIAPQDAAGDAALPEGAEHLADHVKAPDELHRRLQQVGVVSPEAAATLQVRLAPGQRLVSLAGDLWRWDGFVAKAERVSQAAKRLEQRNRLDAVATEETQLTEALASQETALADVSARLSAAQTLERELRAGWRQTQARVGETRKQHTALERQRADRDSRLSALHQQRERAVADLETVRVRLSALDRQFGDFGDAQLTAAEARRDKAQGEATAARDAAAEARARRDGLKSAGEARRARIVRLDEDAVRWRQRRDAAEAQFAALEARIAETRREHEELAALPERLEAQRQALFERSEAAAAAARAVSDELQRGENAARESVEALRAAQAAVAREREARAALDARLEAQRARRDGETHRIAEVFDTDPAGCLKLAELPEGAEPAPLADVERRLQKLRADRERLGGVNLQADEDLERLSGQVEEIERERSDVQEAVDKLRQGIGQLNREGRRRLNEAFETVNGHFGRLFETLFGGGEARLEMIQSQDDPLEGGLEIVAKPPGKKPATLSLLSGGEQTLTALALIFAVFLTNPSPICVLDEVDAPLDDANVDRFCTLMERMAEETSTRFLVITHHPMTMTRMDRLFGVTMAEKGISQLVSVDLETAQAFREAG